MSNKNKQAVGYLYPKIRYTHSETRTQYEFGKTLGSLNRWMFGVSRMLNDKVSGGYQMQYCSLKPKVTHSLSLKKQINSLSNMTATLQASVPFERLALPGHKKASEEPLSAFFEKELRLQYNRWGTLDETPSKVSTTLTLNGENLKQHSSL